MKFWRHNLSPTVVLLVLLPILLGVLATLQYQWLSEISRAERERLQARLQADTQRFAKDFNNEITKAYFTFQLESDFWENKDFEAFAERYDVWRKQSEFPGMVSRLYFVELDGQNSFKLHHFKADLRSFESVEWNDALAPVRDKITAQLAKNDDKMPPPLLFRRDAIEPNIPAVIVPLMQRFSFKTPEAEGLAFKTSTPLEPKHFIVIGLNSDVIKSEVLPELARRNFAEHSSYNFAVVKRDAPEKVVYNSAPDGKQIVQADARESFFDLAPETANVLILDGAPRVRIKGNEATQIYTQTIETVRKRAPAAPAANGAASVQIHRRSDSISAERITSVDEPRGNWLLTVQHTDGSLENYVGRAKWRNLGLSFGILTLLGASVVLLILSTHRAKLAAQRQIDFVSSVSHEFRTPVAVICSAGDNLADGIVNNQAQVEKYGKLIRREGNRLTEMVEQILQFAGARSGRQKYSFQTVEIAPVIKEVLTDCQPLLEEKGFEIETDISTDLPVIEADAKALQQALQNLVSNAAKYSNGTRWIKIEAESNGENVTLSVIDKGIGIEPRELKQIFEPFYRGKMVVDAQIHGNGLGLSLVKQIVEAHHGKITVESEPHKGSKFTIQIPKKSES